MRFDELEQLVEDEAITTVVVGFTDHYGRTWGSDSTLAFLRID
ncbi:MAG: hypothetical protein R2706_19775 [Acidimicrobiales bacterium]